MNTTEYPPVLQVKTTRCAQMKEQYPEQKDEFLCVNQVKTEYPCLSTGSLANLRCRKEGPKYYKINRKVLYRRSDLEAWFGSQPILTRDSLPEKG